MTIDARVQGRTALVTGASSGLGADFARDLARRGAHLILVARRADLLTSLQAELASTGVKIETIALDLIAPDAPQQLYDQLKAAGQTVDILINNAGLGIFGEFLEIPWEREHNMLELDIVTLTHLTKLFARDMVARRFGYILQIASIGAYQPSPTYATYSAAKAYVLSFGEALAYELRRHNVKVSVLSPGVTKTEFLHVAGQQPTFYQRMAMMDSPTVTRQGIDALLRGQTSLVPGFMNAVTAFSTRLMPRQFAAALAHRTMTMK